MSYMGPGYSSLPPVVEMQIPSGTHPLILWWCRAACGFPFYFKTVFASPAAMEWQKELPEEDSILIRKFRQQAKNHVWAKNKDTLMDMGSSPIIWDDPRFLRPDKKEIFHPMSLQRGWLKIRRSLPMAPASPSVFLSEVRKRKLQKRCPQWLYPVLSYIEPGLSRRYFFTQWSLMFGPHMDRILSVPDTNTIAKTFMWNMKGLLSKRHPQVYQLGSLNSGVSTLPYLCQLYTLNNKTTDEMASTLFQSIQSVYDNHNWL